MTANNQNNFIEATTYYKTCNTFNYATRSETIIMDLFNRDKVKRLEERINNLNQQNDMLIKSNASAESQIRQMHVNLIQWQMRAMQAELALRSTPPQKASPGPSQELIERCISLCHPDKHNNSEKANKVTQELLKMRKK
jgi:hypothetical protein